MKQVGRVEVLEGFEELPNDVLFVNVGEDSCSNHCMQVCAAQSLCVCVCVFVYVRGGGWYVTVSKVSVK